MAASKKNKLPIISFNAGLISDMVAARVDFPQRFQGGRVVDNFIPSVQGPLIGRPGTIYTGEVAVSASNNAIIGLNTASGTNYLVEMSEFLLRFWKNNAVLSGSNVSISSVGGSATVTFTSGTSGVMVNWTGHNLPAGASVQFTNSGGALPAEIVSGTTYYVVLNADYHIDSFGIAATPYGTSIAYSAAGTGTHTGAHRMIVTSAAHGFKNDDVITISGGTGGSPSINGRWVVKCVNNAPKTISAFDGTGDYATVTAHGLSDGDRIFISMDDTATLPTGLSDMSTYTPIAATAYYAIVSTVDRVKFSSTADSTAINLVGAGSGTWLLYSNKASTMTRFQLAPLDGDMEELAESYNTVNQTNATNCTHFSSVTGTLVANWTGKHTPFTDAQTFDTGRLKLGTAILGDSLFFTSSSHWQKKLTVNSDYDWDFTDYAHDVYWYYNQTTRAPIKMPYYFDGPYEETNSNVRYEIHQKQFDIETIEKLYFRKKAVVVSGEEGMLLRNDCEDYSTDVRPAFGLITKINSWTNSNSIADADADAEIYVLQTGSPVSRWISRWRKGLIHSTTGYPRKVGFAEDRMCLGGFTDYPARMELSEASSYTSFKPTDSRDTREVLDENAISIQMTAQSVGKLNWMTGGSAGVFIGCTGGVYLISGADGGGLKPGGVRQTLVSNFGCEDIQPIAFGSQIFYVEAGGKRIRVIDSEKAGDAFELSRLFFDSIDSPIVSWAFAYDPYPVIWAAMYDGSLICVMIERQDNVVAGFTGSLGGSGLVKSITTLKDTNNNDKVYFLVERTINGSTKKYIERLAESPYVDTSIAIEDAVCSDSSYVYDGAAITNFTTELAHLAGATVDVVADGKRLVSQTVTAGGALTSALSVAASTIIVGFSFRPIFESLDLEAQIAQGMTLGNIKRVNQADIGFYRSLGGKIGKDSSNMNEIDFGSYTTTNVSYFTGVKKEGFNGDHIAPTRFRYEQVIPAPVCITFISPEVGIND